MVVGPVRKNGILAAPVHMTELGSSSTAGTVQMQGSCYRRLDKLPTDWSFEVESHTNDVSYLRTAQWLPQWPQETSSFSSLASGGLLRAAAEVALEPTCCLPDPAQSVSQIETQAAERSILGSALRSHSICVEPHPRM